MGLVFVLIANVFTWYFPVYFHVYERGGRSNVLPFIVVISISFRRGVSGLLGCSLKIGSSNWG